ncbi:SDR family oxidoreductase [Cupriavidus sp. AU9028]|uniref:SDR family oxidoreductase n=1 Tax=Cupriavidus sp. AU9028 TaxID=2871157 RepID=UPI001C96CB7B|nr:SDR family oxidoreductase [Cupriavidus sp. AU9028]MBY4896076.1 SDR family oxidoreductase [Cupriavidus sp. AU9028]
MKSTLKKLDSQVMVITGATSGVGLLTARRAAQRGAKLVLAARSAEVLHRLAEELRESGAEVITVAADVGNLDEVKALAQAAIERFGGFDTWVNNAGVTVYGRHSEVPVEDQRKLFDTNYWGTVHGSLVAAAHLRERGGAIINIGSEASDVPLPLQSAYAASKHAVKGFTDSLRLELEQERAPISVTLIKPAALDTPFAAHAKNYLEVEPDLPPPVYDPELAAEAILYAAEHPRRDMFVGAASKAMSSMAYHMPGVYDRVMRRFLGRAQRTNQPAGPLENNALYNATNDLVDRQGRPHVVKACAYSASTRHPVATGAMLIGASLGIAAALTMRRGRLR